MHPLYFISVFKVRFNFSQKESDNFSTEKRKTLNTANITAEAINAKKHPLSLFEGIKIFRLLSFLGKIILTQIFQT